jgi:primosomal protein N' (replication factor Y)
MQRRGAMSEVLAAVHQGDPCILLGTQMLTKGHHFPDVTLVGLIDTDAGLFSADFRGPERMGQLLTQVAGRAGRADKPGHVILQTHYPDHPLVRILLEQGYDGFAAELLEQRRQAGLPPFGQLLMLRAEARQMAMAEEFLRDVRAGAEKNSSGEVQFIGPLPAPMQRKSGRYRAQLLLSSPSRSAVQRAAQTLVDVAEDLPAGKRLRWSLDVDPLDTF